MVTAEARARDSWWAASSPSPIVTIGPTRGQGTPKRSGFLGVLALKFSVAHTRVDTSSKVGGVYVPRNSLRAIRGALRPGFLDLISPRTTVEALQIPPALSLLLPPPRSKSRLTLGGFSECYINYDPACHPTWAARIRFLRAGRLYAYLSEAYRVHDALHEPITGC